MEMGVWLPLLCVLGLFAAATSGDQCHNSPCTQTNFREYSNCIQTSCNNNCQCSNVRCNSCQTSDVCCQRCCQNTNYVQSSCTNNNCQSNCQSGNCQSNCQSSNCQTNCQQQGNCQPRCPTPPPRTCADVNCRTCRGDECMGCCEFRTTTEQSGEPNTRPPIYYPPPSPNTCNVTNVFKPTIPMPNITITINQPPIHITTGPVMNNISVPCPGPGNLSCPPHNSTVVVVRPDGPNCCNIPSPRCVPTANPATPYCYNVPQPACGSQCLAQQQPPPQYVAPPPQYVAPYIPPPRYEAPYIPPQPIYIPRYIQPPPVQCPATGCPIAAPQPQYVRMPAPQYVQMPAPQYVQMPAPQYVQMPAPQYVQMPAPQYVQMPAPQCQGSSCPIVAQPYYAPTNSCVGQWPYTSCSVAGGGGYYPGTGGNVAAVPLAGAAMPYPYGQQYVVQPNGKKIGTKKSGDDDTAAEDDEEDSSE